MLTNMVTLNDLKEKAEYDDLVTDISGECSNYGQIVSLVIPRPNQFAGDSGVGKVFIQYADQSSATLARSKLNGRTFASNTIQATYYDESRFRAKKY